MFLFKSVSCVCMSWFVSSQEIYDDVFMCVCVFTPWFKQNYLPLLMEKKQRKTSLFRNWRPCIHTHTPWDFQRFFFHPRSTGFINRVQKHATLKRSSNWIIIKCALFKRFQMTTHCVVMCECTKCVRFTTCQEAQPFTWRRSCSCTITNWDVITR